MADEIKNNNPNRPLSPQGNQGRPMLKKVKRPVKKLVKRPLPAGMPQTPQKPSGGNQQPFLNSKNENVYAPVSNQLPKKVYTPPVFNNEPPQFISDQDLQENQPASSGLTAGEFFTRKALLIVAAVTFIIGFGFAKLFFTEQKVVNAGLQGVVANPEVPRGRARCGIAEKTQGCVLYIMNPQRQDLNARDFYDLASQLTGRQRFVIETGNMRYSNVKISPGEIAQFNIPPLQ